ncbi:hypothetical protein EVAR_102233_1 [Eumeta japonica]|uniref:Uncharacterized protein n=1 Tax=Eumeta variegata TaxID=151549 RepID=A0A4C1WEI6_EUMVA|nr:hypothetical protein EVAR_102233_1 [Eumeta japonica]
MQVTKDQTFTAVHGYWGPQRSHHCIAHLLGRYRISNGQSGGSEGEWTIGTLQETSVRVWYLNVEPDRLRAAASAGRKPEWGLATAARCEGGGAVFILDPISWAFRRRPAAHVPTHGNHFTRLPPALELQWRRLRDFSIYSFVRALYFDGADASHESSMSRRSFDVSKTASEANVAIVEGINSPQYLILYCVRSKNPGRKLPALARRRSGAADDRYHHIDDEVQLIRSWLGSKPIPSSTKAATLLTTKPPPFVRLTFYDVPREQNHN